MRLAIVLLIAMVSANATFAADLGSSQVIYKKTTPAWSVPVSGGNKVDCGEDKSSACQLDFGVPNVGTTAGMLDDYDVACPYTGSSAPDYVYFYIPTSDIEISVTLCRTGANDFDTKVYIVRDSDDMTIACNDDYSGIDQCGPNDSYISSVDLTGGEKYYIIVDGYGTHSGPYSLLVEEVLYPACEVIAEGDPYLEDEILVGDVDTFNSGCAQESGMPQFQELLAYETIGELNFSGGSGWFQIDETRYRDTDWFTAIFDDLGLITWEVTAEQRMTMYRLTTGDCDALHVIAQATVIPCETQRLVLNGDPGDVAWLWLGPESYDPPAGSVGVVEFPYVMTLEGLFGFYNPILAVESSTWDSLKAMYR